MGKVAKFILMAEDEESFLASYRAVTTEFNFTGIQAFRRCINRERDFASESVHCNEYILFTGVSMQDMTMIDQIRRSLPKMHCLYDAREEALIVKLMGNFAHEVSSRRFFLIFMYKLSNLELENEIICMGATRLGDERRHKEPDESFKPLSTRPTIDAWASLVFEVGVSASIA